jgi:hypothetical protein
MRIFFCLLVFLNISINVFSQKTDIDYFENLNSKERNIIVDKGTEYPNTGK